MATRRRWRACTAIRLAIAVSAIHLAILFVFGRYPKSLSVLDDTFVASAAAVFALLILDWILDPTANGAESPARRPEDRARRHVSSCFSSCCASKVVG